MYLRIVPLLILSPLLLLASCGETETPVVRNPPPKKVVSQNMMPPVLENSGMTAIVQPSTGATSTGAIKYEIINGIEVPPEPDPVSNNATLAGVDANENGVRDDVEREIALNIKDKSKFKEIITYANHYQKTITNPMPIDRSGALAQIAYRQCSISDAGMSEIYNANIKIEDLFANNSLRKEKLAKFYDKTGAYFLSEIDCSQENPRK